MAPSGECEPPLSPYPWSCSVSWCLAEELV